MLKSLREELESSRKTIKRPKQDESAEEKNKTLERENKQMEVIVPMSGLNAGMVQYCAETMKEALVLSVRVFGVSAAQVHQAEQQCAGRTEVVAVLEEVLTGAQKQDERVRPALEVWRREQHTMLGPLHQHHEHAEMQIWRRERPTLPSLPHRHLSHEATNTTGARPAGTPGAPHRHLSHEALNMSGARPDGAPGATVGTARLAVLLAVRALGTNAERVAQVDQRQSDLDELIAVLLTILLDCQKRHSLVLAAEQGKGAAVSWLLGAGVDPNSVGSEALAGGGNCHRSSSPLTSW